jgi:hypothetical protein
MVLGKVVLHFQIPKHHQTPELNNNPQNEK